MPVKDVAISVRGISKSYTIAHTGERYSTLAETMVARMRNPFDRRSRETFWALKDVAFDVDVGEIVGIIGRNGAGKSTILKIMSRITEPTAGEIDLYGRVGSLLEVGTGFHPELTGRENVFLNGAILGMKRREIEDKFDEIVAFAEVERFLDTPVKRYSSGMYVRLAFAVAAHLEPEILIVDEVLAVGDAAFQKKCLGKMGEVAKEGRTVLFVSHNMLAIQALCQTCIWMESGRLADYGSAPELIARYTRSGIASQAANGSLADCPRRSDLPGACFTSYELHSAGGRPISEIRFGQPFRMRFACRADHDLSGVVFAINWFDESGYLINRTNNRSVGMPDLAIPSGDCSLEVRYDDMPLLPGRYRIGVALQDGAHGYYDWLDQSIELEVIDDSSSPIRLIHGASNGFVWLPVCFEGVSVPAVRAET